jgi:hypothetical protein
MVAQRRPDVERREAASARLRGGPRSGDRQEELANQQGEVAHVSEIGIRGAVLETRAPPRDGPFGPLNVATRRDTLAWCATSS